MFRNREDAGRQLAEKLKAHRFQEPVIVAIPRGGVAIGAVLAHELDAELDVLLCRKLRAPWNPELAIGAVTEYGSYFLNEEAADMPGMSEQYVEQEVQRQSKELANRKALYRRVRPSVPLAGRSVIVTDDGIATGATIVAGLQALQAQHPFEVIVAVPVAAPEKVDHLRCWCDEVVCCDTSPEIRAISQAYQDFPQLDDGEVIRLLAQCMAMQTATERARSHGPVRMPIEQSHGQ